MAKENLDRAIEVRSRVYGMTKEQAAKMKEGSWLAALEANGEITPRQYEAAGLYQQLRSEYTALHPPNQRERAAADMDRGGGYDGNDGTDPDYVRRFQAIAGRMAECRKALSATSTKHRDWRISIIAEKCLVEGYWQPHLMPSLRRALDALAEVFSLPVDTTSGKSV